MSESCDLVTNTIWPFFPEPCKFVACSNNTKCEEQAAGSTQCVCQSPEDCPDDVEPVCGSNRKTYDNECLFKVEACGTDMTFKQGRCGELWSYCIAKEKLVKLLPFLTGWSRKSFFIWLLFEQRISTSTRQSEMLYLNSPMVVGISDSLTKFSAVFRFLTFCLCCYLNLRLPIH